MDPGAGDRARDRVRFPGGVEASDPALWIYVGFWISTLALGAAGAWRARRAGRYAVTRPGGGVPVEIVG
jgi:hypothetical protein